MNHHKGKGVSRPSELTKERESATLCQEECGVEKGALALLDRVRKLKEKAGAYISQFISNNGSQSILD